MLSPAPAPSPGPAAAAPALDSAAQASGLLPALLQLGGGKPLRG